MKQNNNRVRRFTALLMCVCMLLSNVNVAFSDTATKVSAPVAVQDGAVLYASALASAALSDYADISFELYADRDHTPLPNPVEDGQSLFFQMAFDLLATEGNDELLKVREAFQSGLIDENTVFTCDIDFLKLVGNTNYPTSFDSPDNTATDPLTSMKVFRWWVDETNGKLCLRFTRDLLEKEGSVSNTKVAFEGQLDAGGRDDNGGLHFGVDNETVSLLAKQDYTVTKAAGVPYFDLDAGAYLVDYTVTLTLGQNMSLDTAAAGDLYAAALTLEDTVLAGGALTGELFGDPEVTAPAGETASVAVAAGGATNTLTVSSPDQVLSKGEYTFVYKMKVDSAAALNKLSGYTDAQKTNTVEVKENGDSLKTPLTASATIAWDKVTENQFKIDKNAFTEKAPDFKGVYWDEENDKYYIDFRVVVYVREPVSTFTVTDHPNYALSFRTAPAPATLEGVDLSPDYWNNDISTAVLSTLSGADAPTVTAGVNGNGENVITVTAPEGKMLPPGAYHLRVPADVTAAVESTLNKSYPQTYSNTAFLTSVDNQPTNESKEFKQPIVNRTEPQKAGGYETNPTTGELLFVNGKPLIRWDVWFGWDFYNETSFVDTLTGMELLVNSDYPFEIHSFIDQKHYVERLASLNSLTDTTYLDFNENGTGFTFNSETLDTNADGSHVKLYKLVYFSTPLTNADGTGYITTGLKNNYVLTHTTPGGDGFGTGPITGEAVPELTSNGRLYVSKKHVIELNNSWTQWKITCNNQNKIPFAIFDNLDIIDLVPRDQTPIGEVTIYYSDEHPITVEMVCDNNAKISLVEGVHYNILKQHEKFDFGENGKYGFAVDLNMEAVAAAMAEKGAVYFKTIDVLCYLENEKHPSGQNYRIKNDGWLDYSNQGVELQEGANAYYDRGFATMWKGVHPYDDFYNPNATRRYFVCNEGVKSWQNFVGGYDFNPETGDGQKEIVWRIYIGAREYGNDDKPITVTVTDTFSDNQMFPTYEGKEMKDLFLIRAEDAMDYIIIPDSVVVQGNTFTLTFTVPGGGWAAGNKDKSKDIIIDYHTILKPEAIKEALDNADESATQVIVPYSNTANAGWNGESYDIPTETSSYAFSTQMLDKTSSIITAVSEIEYSILINENRLTLNDGQPLVLTDELGAGKEGFLYRDDSVRLINMDNATVLTPGSSVTDSTYTITWAKGDTKGFTISVPDGQRLQLTYRVKPMAPIGTETSALVNSASLDGKTDTHTQDSFRVSASNQEATYTPPEGTVGISIRKLEGDSSIQILLPGATFTAYPVNADGTLGAAAGTWTTDANGKAMLTFKRNGDAGYDTVYCIKETAAPEGYIANSSEWYFYFSTDSHEFANDAVAAIVAKLRSDGKNVQQVMNETVLQMNVENLPVTCDLRIRKTDMAGNDLSGAVFTLQDAKGNQMPAPVAKTEDGIAYYVYEGLKSGSYTLTEVQPPVGYRSGPQSSWDITLDAGEETVTVNWEAGTADEDKAYVTETRPAGLTILNRPALPAGLELPVVKTLDGADTTDAVFSFTIQPVDAGQPMPAAATITTEGAAYADGSAEISFGPIQFTYDMIGQVYTYRISENTVAGSTGFTGSAKVYEVDVTVLWKNNAMAAEISAIRCDGTECGAVEFINTFVPFVSISGTKTWSDADNQDNLRPDSITLNLLANGNPALDGDGNAITLEVSGEGDSWSWSFTDLPQFEDGVAIEYTVTEEEVEGYQCQITGSAAEGFEVVNTHEPEVTEATIIKVWEDGEDQDGIRPASLTVTLLADGETVQTVTLNDGNSWTATIDNLPKKADGAEITYSWSEDETVLPEGYSLTGNTTAGTVTTLTNSYTPEVTEATIIKVWEDAEDQDGIRPDSLTVTLLADGETVQTVTLNEANSWTATIDNLPKKAAGAEITYSWSEDETVLPEGYSLTGNTTAGTVTTLTNSYTPEVTEATIIKVWDDAEDQDGIRPASLTVTLLADGETVRTVTLNDVNSWTATIDNLPKKADGAEITYSWSEDETVLSEGYSLTGNTTAGTVTTLTNSYTPEVTEATIIKVWEDAEDQDGIRPASLTVTLLADGETVRTVTLNDANSWTATIDNLPKKADGAEITYSWSEDETVLSEGYSLTGNTTAGTVTTLTNSYTPETITISGEKIWDDADDQDDLRPDSVTINLLAGGEKVDSKTVTIGGDGKWSFTFENLPACAAGERITYTITEETVTGYTTAITGSAADGFTVKNTHKPAVVSISVSKRWNDGNDQDGLRPDSITVNLLADGEVVASESITPDGDGNWSYTFADLPKFKAGVEIGYTIAENSIEGYQTGITGSMADGFVITNTRTPDQTSVSGVKTWDDAKNQDGLRPVSILITLYADGDAVDTRTVTEADQWSWSFTGLPQRSGGVDIVYTIGESDLLDAGGNAVEVYTTEINGYNITNSYTPETVDVSGSKIWDDDNNRDGLRPESITINLLADGVWKDSAIVTPDADGNWSWSFTGLPKYRDAGTEIGYTITEDTVTGYTATVSNYNVTNTHTPETIDISGSKTWDDDNNRDGLRPESITINLLADETVVDTVTVTPDADGNWAWSFTDLPKYETGKVGHELTYTIEEVLSETDAANYTATVSNYNVTNTHIPETIDISGSKIWDDDNNRDGLRPESITISLLADETVADTVTVTPDADGNWTWSFTDLPKYETGKVGHELTYTIEEVLSETDAANYTATVSNYNVTNTHTPETIDISGSKIWDDDSNRDGLRPESITINLLADETVADTVTVTPDADGNWTWSFTDLPKYETGKVGHELTYTIEEVLSEADAANYTATISNYNVTNTHTPETIDISGSKTWDDDNNRDGLRPESITINLLADETVVDTVTVTPDADGNWTWSFTDLPKYETGKVGHELTYTIEEVLSETDAANYTATVSNYNVTNTHIPETIDISGSKIWDDDNNRDGLRPESITISLLADETVVDTVTVTPDADGNWTWSFTDLPKYETGKVGHELTYTIEEVLSEADAANYTATVSGYDVTNTHTPATREISGSKNWDDMNDACGKRPESITIHLLADGAEVASQTVTAADDWSWSFAELPVYQTGLVGHEISYTISEDAVPGYTTAIDGFDVTNTLYLTGFLKLDEQTGRPLSGAEFALYAGRVTKVEGEALERWTSDGNVKLLAGLTAGETYTIIETKTPSGFVTMRPFVFTVQETDTPDSYRTFTAENRHIYRFRKLDSSTNGLVYNAMLRVMMGETVIDEWFSSAENDGWHSIADERFSPGVTYTLVELVAPEGYLKAEPVNFTIDPITGLLIIGNRQTNSADLVMYDQPAPKATPTPEPATTELQVTKRWEDQEDVLGLRPDTITLNLFRKTGGANWPSEPFMTVTMADNGKDVWTFTFSDLPRRDADGNLYAYMVEEEPVEGYTVTYLNNGRTIVNSIPQEDLPPTPTPTLPYATPTPAPSGRPPVGVKFVDGEWVYVDEYGVPLGLVPQTGDYTNFSLWGMAILLPMLVAALAAVEIRRRKRLMASSTEDREE